MGSEKYLLQKYLALTNFFEGALPLINTVSADYVVVKGFFRVGAI
jgi:hypothetical protein